MASLRKTMLMLVAMAMATSIYSVDACGGGCPGYGSGSGGSGSGSSPVVKPGGGGHHGGSGGSGGAGAGTGGGAATTCPVDIVKLNVCSPLLGGAIAPGCCPLLGLLGVHLDICLCLAVDLNVLGLVTVNIPKLDIVATIATSCGYTLPPNFTCPA